MGISWASGMGRGKFSQYVSRQCLAGFFSDFQMAKVGLQWVYLISLQLLVPQNLRHWRWGALRHSCLSARRAAYPLADAALLVARNLTWSGAGSCLQNSCQHYRKKSMPH